MTTLAIYTFAGASVVLAGLVLSGRRIRRPWLVVWGVAPVILVYALNPGFRVSSFHSFMHGGIVYRILGGDVPPGDPLVAGYAVHYPWGTHLVAAAISLALRTTPFYALAVLNVAALAAVLVIIYRISCLLTEDRLANILSVMVACYAVTPVIPEMLRPLPAGFPTEIRGIPIIHKFITVNNLPVGLVFFLLALHAAMRLYAPGGIRRAHAIRLLVWTSACGFFYPAFLPGLVGGAVLGYLVGLFLWLRNRTGPGPARGLLPLAAVGVGAAVLLPYLMATGSGTVASMEVLSLIHI